MSYRWLAVLDTFWGWRGHGLGREEAPRYFTINPDNFTGRRLYYLTGEESGCQWCTDACREVVYRASDHGTPDLKWLEANLDKWLGIMRKKSLRLSDRVETPAILVCGKVAQQTYSQLDSKPLERTIYLPHPAARNWTRQALERAARFIQEGKQSLRMEIKEGQLEVYEYERDRIPTAERRWA